MTLWDLVRALVRRWPVVLLGLIGTAGFTYFLMQAEPVYFTQAQVVFLAPSSERYPNSLKTRSEDLIITAGAVAKRVVGPERQLKHADTAVNLVGIPGENRGYWVRLPNAGGQWGSSHEDQLLIVDAAGPTAEEAEAFREEAIARIGEELTRLQDDAGVASVNRITVTIAPPSPVVYPIRGSRIRATGMAAAIGMGATIGAVVLLEVRARQRRSLDVEPPARDDEEVSSGVRAQV